MVTKDGVYILDMAAKIDATADYICKPKWGDLEFPPPFGREAYPEVENRTQIMPSNTHVRDHVFSGSDLLCLCCFLFRRRI